ncbi:peptidyl-Lys metalloendopeptidase [Collybia nuda]|uniref:Peptidyl-Lys metalloendopeptidase n=1 Tax=Collybia nuda TaxID=64659 RepID=A0A9P5Y9S1_9AGAR|nr:peptidyl-Lys metalloendopeptidase [Collybia nuda]
MRLASINSTALRVVLTSLILSGLVSAAPGLSATVSGPDVVTDVKNLHLQVTMTNTGTEPLKLINDPRGPLTTSPTESFLISGPNKVDPAFVGISVKYAGVDFMATNGASNAFTVLGVGKSVVIAHDLSKGYDFGSSGPGKYTFSIVGKFHRVDSSKHAVSIQATTRSHQLTLKGDLSIANHQPDMHGLATFVNCNATQQSQVNTAITNAKTYVTGSINYLTSHTTGTPRFTTWFGVFQNTRYRAVLSNFNSLISHGDEFTGWQYNCAPATGCDPGDVAYVQPTVYGKVYLCGGFWTAPATGTDSKAGTLVHEGSHFVATAGTTDIAYGQTDCKQLAISNPNQAIRNADSYEYFAENTPPLQ